MQRGTSMAIALAQAAAGKTGLGIELCINDRVNNSTKGVKSEPDVFIRSERFTGAYTVGKPATPRAQEQAAAEQTSDDTTQ